MDENKKKKLQEIKYEVFKCCGLCADFMRSHQTMTFGTCAKNEYEHLKHTEPSSPLSVTAFGGCPDWSQDQYKVALMHGFNEFKKGA
jgi:hypothetical protein